MTMLFLFDALRSVTTISGLFAAIERAPVRLALALWQEQPPTEESVSWIESLWTDYINHKWVVGNFSLSLTSLALGVAVLLAALIISRSIQNFLERRLAARTHLDPGIQYTILRLIHYVIIALGVMFAFRFAFNADLTTLAVIFTALSVGIGFGLQFIAGDIASGFILLFERPVRVGDFVTVGGATGDAVEGRVKNINLRTTVVLTNDNITMIVPNSKLVNENLVNWSYEGKRARIPIPVGVAYNSDVDVVTQTLLRAAEDVRFVLAEPKPSVQFMGFGESSLDFRLLVWTDRPRRHPVIKSDINYHIHHLFAEEGIEIPFPQRDLNLRAGALKISPRDENLSFNEAEIETGDEEMARR